VFYYRDVVGSPDVVDGERDDVVVVDGGSLGRIDVVVQEYDYDLERGRDPPDRTSE